MGLLYSDVSCWRCWQCGTAYKMQLNNLTFDTRVRIEGQGCSICETVRKYAQKAYTTMTLTEEVDDEVQ